MTSQHPMYTGHVEPHGDPSTRELGEVTVTKMSVGPMDNNTYLLVCRHTGDAVLIDAANDSERSSTSSGTDPIGRGCAASSRPTGTEITGRR